jgi:hypothetical protein
MNNDDVSNVGYCDCEQEKDCEYMTQMVTVTTIVTRKKKKEKEKNKKMVAIMMNMIRWRRRQ